MTPSQAVKELRAHCGDSQQAFATKLGLSIRAIANYEKGREPTLRSLIRLKRLAHECGRTDLEAIFDEKAKSEAGSGLGDIEADLLMLKTVLLIREANLTLFDENITRQSVLDAANAISEASKLLVRMIEQRVDI